MVITEVTEAFDPDCRFSLVQDAIATGGVVLGIKLEDAGSVMTTKPTKDLQAEAKSIDEKGVLVAHVRENGSWHVDANGEFAYAVDGCELARPTAAAGLSSMPSVAG